MRFMQELLSFVGIEGRLHLEWISSAEAQKFANTIISFTDKIKEMGPSQLTTMLTASEAEAFIGSAEQQFAVAS